MSPNSIYNLNATSGHPRDLALPPWQQNIFSSMIAAMGKQLKQSVKVFHNLILYRRLPETTHHELQPNACQMTKSAL